MTDTLGAWLEREPFTLTLSSGFFGFYAHAGVVSALIESKITPARVSGSSAGALVGGVWASGRAIAELRDALFELERRDFWDPGLGFGLLRGELFQQKLLELLACRDFSETRCPLQITAFLCSRLRGVTLTQGALAPAIRASCAFPGLFQPVWIDGEPHLDGGISDRPGWSGVPAEERVFYHHLASRSRWRSALGLTSVPQRPRSVGLKISGLPRCSPSRLSAGPSAFERARVATLRALERPLPHRPEDTLALLEET